MRRVTASSSSLVLELSSSREYNYHVTLLDLPDDLLDRIASFLPSRTLLKLAYVCRRLNTTLPSSFLQTTVTLNFIISHFYGEFGEDRAEHQDLSLLSALHIAFSLRRIKVLTCCILVLRKVFVRDRTSLILNGIHDLVERLDCVDHVKLHISCTEDPGWHHDPAHHPVAGKWARNYRRLVNMLMKKSPKVEFDHHGILPSQFHQILALSPSLPYISLFQKLQRSFFRTLLWSRRSLFKHSGTSLEFKWSDEWGHGSAKKDFRIISPAVDKNLKVEALTLSGSTVLLSPCIDWLPSFFISANLTRLTLSSIDLLAEFWNVIISLISPTVSRLQHLKQRGHRLNFQRAHKAKFLRSWKILYILWGDDESPYVHDPFQTPLLIRAIHAILQPRRPVFEHLGFRSFRYENGKIGLVIRDKVLLPYTSTQEIDMLALDVFDGIQLQYDSASKLAKDKKLLEGWLRCFGSLKVLELGRQQDSAPLPGIVRDETCERTQLAAVAKEVLSVVYKGGVDLVVDE
ncbi:hypothetical protein AX16_007295 [Volvariella volvacea WC 439]|nr:hypothetical protein AX16_007295 [Volvariella volvacea WC 439]